MTRGLPKLSQRKGVTTAETLMLLPLYFLLVFSVIQIGQLAIAIAVANYAASSIAREAVRIGSSSSGDHQQRLRDLLVGGMKQPEVFFTTTGEGLFRDLTVEACAEVSAFPMIGPILGRALVEGMGSRRSNSCQGMRVLAFNTQPPGLFVVHGKATVRMNYKP